MSMFAELFVGAALAHGLWHVDRGAETVRAAAAAEDYEAHLAGQVGLGLVPVREDGTCRFAAIDVDQDTIDHAKVAAHVAKRKFPLTVCRSKSGGAHLYAFFPEPGLPSGRARELLTKWAGVLGFPSTEIFPKQVKISKKNTGNWINLPYFSAARTIRYAVDDEGKALTLDEFLAFAKIFDETNYQGDESVDAGDSAELPPCLRALSRDGVPEGMRNQVLFNMGVFYRKSNPDGWTDQLTQTNLTLVKPPLPFRELSAVSKSLSQSRYQYQCEQSPLRERCDRLSCLKLKFGVANKPWEEADQYDQLLVTNLRKVLTEPPRYVLEVNGKDVHLSLEEFQSFKEFRQKLLGARDLVVRPMKQLKWDASIKELLKSKQDIEAPPDASVEGQVLDAISSFVEATDKAKSREDLLRGLPVKDGERILFRFADLQRYLQGRRLEKLSSSEVYEILRVQGCNHTHVSICGKKFLVWTLPASALSVQTEDFTPAARRGPKLEQDV